MQCNEGSVCAVKSGYERATVKVSYFKLWGNGRVVGGTEEGFPSVIAAEKDRDFGCERERLTSEAL